MTQVNLEFIKSNDAFDVMRIEQKQRNCCSCAMATVEHVEDKSALRKKSIQELENGGYSIVYNSPKGDLEIGLKFGWTSDSVNDLFAAYIGNFETYSKDRLEDQKALAKRRVDLLNDLYPGAFTEQIKQAVSRVSKSVSDTDVAESTNLEPREETKSSEAEKETTGLTGNTTESEAAASTEEIQPKTPSTPAANSSNESSELTDKSKFTGYGATGNTSPQISEDAGKKALNASKKHLLSNLHGMWS